MDDKAKNKRKIKQKRSRTFLAETVNYNKLVRLARGEGMRIGDKLNEIIEQAVKQG